MLKRTTLVIAAVLLLFSAVFSQTVPVKHLAGRTETGQPHLYWFGAAAVESELFYDDGVSDWPVFVSQQWDDDQVLVRFGINEPFFLIKELSAFVHFEFSSDTIANFALSVRRDTANLPPGPMLSYTPTAIIRSVQDSGWVADSLEILIVGDTSFWGALHWFSGSPTNPRIGEDRTNGNSGRNFVGYEDSFFIWNHGGNRMIRAKVLVNRPISESADNFLVYRGTDLSSLLPIDTVGPGQFDYLDSPPTSGDYYYRVTRWDNGLESPLSNAILLSASPTSVKNREKDQSVFLLSEPFPNPFSIGVLFTARTEKQMDLGFSIYNLLGQKVFSQSSQTFSAGEHRFNWRGEDASGTKLPSGAYFLRFQAGEEIIVKKLLLLR